MCIDIQYIASLYESIPLFRDSKEQEEAYLSGWYQTAVTDAEAENYAEAYPIFDNLGSYNDSDKMIDYYEARRLEAEGIIFRCSRQSVYMIRCHR